MTQFNEQQLALFQDRYALKDENGVSVEQSPEQMWSRVADAIADTPDEAEEFLNVLSDFKFVPGGRILAGAGAETEKTFYNCYVIPVETRGRRHNRNNNWMHSVEDAGSDSREAIFDTIQTMVDIMSRGGGVGINWSVLRPSGTYLTRVSGTSSGPVGWMDVASTAVGEVEQGGSRRGAAMFMLDDWHPDVLKFIDAKRTKGKIVNANISVAVSDELMEAVRNDGRWTFRFPDTNDPHYNVEWDGNLAQWEASGRKVRTYGECAAKELWGAISESAHASGEPGVVFLGRYNAQSTGASVERIISVNPCGEQGLGAYSVCNLGAMNLERYVITNPSDGGEPVFNWNKLRQDVGVAVRFLDNAIDKNYYFIPETKRRQEEVRRIGLGVMGLADALVRLRIRYGSPEAVKFTSRVFQLMKDSAIRHSQEIAGRKGWALGWNDSMNDRPWLKEYYDRTGEQPFPLRNIFLLTQAPTGTTSLLAGVNSGIEPFFALRTLREDRTGKRWVVQPTLENVLIWQDNGEPTNKPDYVVESKDVSVEEHVAMQAAAQKWVDSSVSKTVNAPKEQTVAETSQVFDLAWEFGLKGIAYYRDGSRSVQVLYKKDPNERIAELEAERDGLLALVEDLNGKLQFKKAQAGVPYGFPPNTAGSGSSTFEMPKDWMILNVVGHPITCSGTVVFEEGCQKCYTCLWSAC